MSKLLRSVDVLYKRASALGNKCINIEESIPSSVKVTAFVIFLIAGAGISYLYLKGKSLPIAQPHGVLADHEKSLISTALLLSLFVVVPVFTMALFIYSKYHVKNTKSSYQPNWDSNKIVEGIWWLIPIIIISILSVITWNSSHDLDPFKPIVSDKKPLTIEVIALDWKWLFLYPDQGLASVNEVHIPVDTPVDFKITSDAPMNSFWVPDLGGQIYAMSGMTTHLQAMASHEGTYAGASSNISGKGFAGMKFSVVATSEQNFNAWSNVLQSEAAPFGAKEYKELALPSEDNGIAVYRLTDESLFDKVLIKYMNATSTSQSTELIENGGTY